MDLLVREETKLVRMIKGAICENRIWENREIGMEYIMISALPPSLRYKGEEIQRLKWLGHVLRVGDNRTVRSCVGILLMKKDVYKRQGLVGL